MFQVICPGAYLHTRWLGWGPWPLGERHIRECAMGICMCSCALCHQVEAVRLSVCLFIESARTPVRNLPKPVIAKH